MRLGLDLYGILLLIFFFSIFIIFSVILIYEQVNGRNFCKEQNFEYFQKNNDAEPGYISCCNITYPEHIRSYNCQILKVRK